jgi:alcohol dehydrogenase class IV
MTVLLNLPRIHFDFGAVQALGGELRELNIKRPLFITDQRLVEHGVFEKVRKALPGGQGYAVFDRIPENPTVTGVDQAHAVYAAEGCDGVVAVGGGSVIDSAKASALLAGHPGPLSVYHRHSEKITAATAPIIAIPTTAGTGSEVTFGAGIHPDPHTPSMNLGSPHFIPKVAICDPELTLSLPKMLTAGTGMDALGQCIEGFLAAPDNPLIEPIALSGIRRAVACIERAVRDGSDREARWHMSMAALQGGIGIHKGLGSAHAVALALSHRGHNHGILVTVAMPAVLRFLQKHAGPKIGRIEAYLGLDSKDDLASFVERLNERIGLPAGFGQMGFKEEDLDQAVDECVDSLFNMTAPRVPTREEYREILAAAL